MSTDTEAQSGVTVKALAEWLVRNRFATLITVWDLTLADVRLAASIAQPAKAEQPPSLAELEALMQAFPDTD